MKNEETAVGEFKKSFKDFTDFLKTITKEEAKELLIESGIYDREGNLTPEYNHELLE